MAVKKPAVKKAAPKKRVSKAKAQEETAKLPPNPNEYSYRGDEDLVIKAKDFLALAEAIEIAVSNGTEAVYPTQLKYIATATGIDVPNPTKEEIKTGAVRAMMDVEGTFAQDNIQQNYKPWLVPKVIDSKKIIFSTHAANVKAGLAVKYDILQAEAQEKQAAAQAAQVVAQAKEAGEAVVGPAEKPKTARKPRAKAKPKAKMSVAK